MIEDIHIYAHLTITYSIYIYTGHAEYLHVTVLNLDHKYCRSNDRSLVVVLGSQLQIHKLSHSGNKYNEGFHSQLD